MTTMKYLCPTNKPTSRTHRETIPTFDLKHCLLRLISGCTVDV